MLAAGHCCGVADLPPAEHINGITHLDWYDLGNRRRRLIGRSNGRALEPGGLALTFGSLGKERKRRPEGRRAARRPFDWIQRASRSWTKGSHLRPIAGGASMEYHVAGPHGHKQKLEIQGGHGPCWPCLFSASGGNRSTPSAQRHHSQTTRTRHRQQADLMGHHSNDRHTIVPSG